MDTFDMHLMDKNDENRKLNWMIFIGTIFVVLVIVLVLAIRFIIKKEMEMVLPFSVPSFSNESNRSIHDVTDGMNNKQSR